MEIIRRVRLMKELCRQARTAGRRIGFVPTLGALHEGHLSLIRRAREVADIVIVSVFVNPTQFAPNEDFDTYPRNLPRDVDLCIAEGVDYVFAPPEIEIYPAGAQAYVDVGELGSRLEGLRRPGHFRGVATVVTKLLQVVQPHIAAFGQKDAQQAVIVRRVVQDLMMDVEVLVLPIVRDTDGVALSSRNARLAPEEREAARALPQALEQARRIVAEGQRSAERILAAAREVLEAQERLSIDYVELVDPEWLESVDHLGREALLVIAVHAGKTRLLDNVLLRPERPASPAGGARELPRPGGRS